MCALSLALLQWGINTLPAVGDYDERSCGWGWYRMAPAHAEPTRPSVMGNSTLQTDCSVQGTDPCIMRIQSRNAGCCSALVSEVSPRNLDYQSLLSASESLSGLCFLCIQGVLRSGWLHHQYNPSYRLQSGWHGGQCCVHPQTSPDLVNRYTAVIPETSPLPWFSITLHGIIHVRDCRHCQAVMCKRFLLRASAGELHSE